MIENYKKLLRINLQFPYVFFVLQIYFPSPLIKVQLLFTFTLNNNPCQKDIESTLWLHDCKLIDILLIESSNVY